MDYKRIYEDFIKARREREPRLTGYTERHHIVPRSLGGGNEPENLIRLTPEDHFFAHLLLAKIHGGTQWRAIHAMAHLVTKSTGKGRSRLRARFEFGHVRRALADHYRKASSGPSGPMADQKFYELRHKDGRCFLGRRFYLGVRSGLSGKSISSLLCGSKMNMHGWYSPAHNPKGLNKSELIQLKVRSKDRHTLYHYDGRVWTGTLHEFKEMTGCQLAWQGARHKAIKGWYAEKSDADKHHQRISQKAKRIAATRGDISGPCNPRYDVTQYDFWNWQTQTRMKSTRYDLCVQFDIPYGDMSAVLSGRRQSVKGWTLWARRSEKFRRPAYEIVLRKGAETVRGTRTVIADMLGVTDAQVSYGIYKMRIGKAKSYMGWALAS